MNQFAWHYYLQCFYEWVDSFDLAIWAIVIGHQYRITHTILVLKGIAMIAFNWFQIWIVVSTRTRDFKICIDVAYVYAAYRVCIV
jgi:hypothetical protein